MTLLRLASSVFLLVVLLKGVPAWRRHRRKFVFQEFGYETERFSLADDGELCYAQWLHPMESKKTFDQSTVDGYREYIKPGNLAIDIGAHTGDTTLPMAFAAGAGGLTLALEPNPYVFKILEHNTSLNPDKARIVPLPYAATEEDGSFTFHYSDASFCNGGFLSTIQDQSHRHEFPLEVQGRNLSRLLRSDYAEWLPRLSFIKIDTEGYDRHVLESLRDIIAEFRPVVVTEVLKRLTGRERHGLYDVLVAPGYDCFLYQEGRRGQTLTREDLMRWRHFDIIAQPG